MNRQKALCGALLFYCFLTLRSWARQPGLSSRAPEQLDYIPMWPWEHLPPLLFLDPFWLELLLKACAWTALGAALSLFLTPGYKVQLRTLGVLAGVELFYYLHDLRLVANFFHVHLYLTFLFLVSRDKVFFTRVGLWMVYWLAALVKLTPSWLQAEYFNSVPARLPYVPEGLVTPAARLLIAVELLAPLCWLSRDIRIRYASVGVLLAFHLYSGVIVGHWYTSLMVPLVLLAFIPFEKLELRRELVPWLACGLFLLGGLWNFVIPGDVRTTAEGRYHGLFMFDANRRVEALIEIEKGDRRDVFRLLYTWPRREILDWRVVITDGRGRPVTAPVRADGVVIFNPDLFARTSSRMFSDPYLYYFYARELERRYTPDRIAIELVQQLDGHAERFTILDIDDFTRLRPRYNPFWRNPWIKAPGPDSAYFWW